MVVARADLHCHSSASDGTRPPAEVVARAAAAGLDAFALTDHDTVAGITEAAAALPHGLALIGGMELSCRREGHSVHLLGYLFDPAYEELAAQTRAIRASRVERVDEAFTPPWIGPGGRAHVRRYALDPAEAIRLVHAAGGVTVLAHPFAVTRGWVVPEDLISELALAGLDGVEVAHPDHDPAQRDELLTVARKLGLVATGGSDDHGALTGDRIGCEATAQEDLDALLKRATGAAVIMG